MMKRLQPKKAWLLAQYKYDHSDSDSDNSSELLQEQVEEEVEQSVVLSPEEIHHGEMQGELHELESVLNDEAQKYMMSKYDIKEMQNKARQLRNSMEGLHRKIQKSKDAAKKVTPNSAFVLEGAEGDDDEAGLFSMFKQDDVQETIQAIGESDHGDMFSMLEESKEAVDVMPSTPNYSIPSKWTGKTPKMILEEWCQKNKVPMPKYHQ